MIEKRFLEPFKDISEVRVQVLFNSGLCPMEDCIAFLKSASDDELQRIGKSILTLYPNEILRQLTNHRESDIDYSFIDDYTSTYGIPIEYTSKDKGRANALRQLLKRNPDLTATEFCKKI
ncbi:hypothetical protein OJ590_08790 [Streptococcus anginosus]|uniref:Uncharacterized protein n=1 Tax=Streptococcus anginosus TaxID=1328 RepID=A0ABT3EBS7_STRAP|nr:hypothetical protein [Streptococcus anginosus]KAA9263548.1 hypothetical protein F6I22_01175 [Streptococcus anginosus]MCW0978855.1 hypothetical protein [Streptococcus anginosus]MCW1013032.1 hypothetical protein [Streptococcus anginosus]MCW1042886.1 hypothetical protein [Streptococcus anginosus]MED5831799.1 hypothetical protein [Streptococcus anginosus]